MTRVRNKRPNFLMTDDEAVPEVFLTPVDGPGADSPGESGTANPADPRPGHGRQHEDPDDADDPDAPEEDEDPEDEDNSGVPTGPDTGQTDTGGACPLPAADLVGGPDLPRSGVIVPPGPLGVHHYEARITIVDAWQYPGNLVKAPEWVDRNWAAYADYDELRDIKPGPALRIPLANGTTALARIDDYVARQEVKLTRDVAEIRLEVWPREQFERMFLPVAIVPTVVTAPIAA